MSQLNAFANLYFSGRLKAELVKLRRMYEEETEKAKQEFMYLHSSKVKQILIPVVQVMLKVIGAGGGAAGAVEQGEKQQLQHRGRDEGGFQF